MSFFSSHSGGTRRPGTSKARLQLEPLESRIVLDGNVRAAFFRGDLQVLGDRYDNAVQVSVENNDLVVEGLNGTTVNGQARFVVEDVGQIPDDLRVNLRRGHDSLVIKDVAIGDDVFINMGRGADHLQLDDLHIGDRLRVHTGRGADTLLLNGGSVEGRANLNTGRGADHLEIATTEFFHRLGVATGRGDDFMFLDPGTVHGRADFYMGRGDDLALVHGANAPGEADFASRVNFHGGRGNDRLEIDVDKVFAGRVRIRGFETVDRVDLNDNEPPPGPPPSEPGDPGDPGDPGGPPGPPMS